MLENADLFSLSQATQARDAGISQVLDNSGDWKSLALIEASYIRQRNVGNTQPFLFETIKPEIIRTIGHPHSENCWGALAMKMRRMGWIHDTGRMELSRHEGSNARKATVYIWR